MLDWITIQLDAGREWGECPMCHKERHLNRAVAWYCGPTHDEIGEVTTEYSDGGIVGGMSVCQPCHDDHYQMNT